MDRINALLLTILLLLSSNSVEAQTDRQIDKCIKIFNTKSYHKGITKLEKYMNAQGGFPNYRAWETLVRMKYKNYKYLDDFYGEMEITFEGNDIDNPDSTADAYKNSLIEGNKNEFINICRRATIMSTSYSADLHLRRLLIDFDPDTLIEGKAKAYFEEAESFFEKGDFELAQLNYRKAIDEEPDYYTATLFLGDAFLSEENYDSALTYFTKAVEIQPGLLEPRQLLIDVLIKKELYVRAKNECIKAMFIYPSNTIKARFQKILKQENKYMEEHKIKKNFYANSISNDEQPELLDPFSTYRNAKSEISKYCNDDGIIESNGKTEDIYLEVYSWRRFIEEHEDDLPEYFRFAQKMIKEGYFDCYILTGLFHVDIYPQLKHFMSNPSNRERTETYINTYLIEAYKE